MREIFARYLRYEKLCNKLGDASFIKKEEREEREEFRRYLKLKHELENLEMERLRFFINVEADKRKLNFEWQDYGALVSWIFLAFPPKDSDFIEFKIGEEIKKGIESRIHGAIFKEVTMNDLIIDKMKADTAERRIIQTIVSDFWKYNYANCSDMFEKEMKEIFQVIKKERIINLLERAFSEDKKSEILQQLKDANLMDKEAYNFAVLHGLLPDRSYIRHLYCQKMTIQKGAIDNIISLVKNLA